MTLVCVGADSPTQITQLGQADSESAAPRLDSSAFPPPGPEPAEIKNEALRAGVRSEFRERGRRPQEGGGRVLKEGGGPKTQTSSNDFQRKNQLAVSVSSRGQGSALKAWKSPDRIGRTKSTPA